MYTALQVCLNGTWTTIATYPGDCTNDPGSDADHAEGVLDGHINHDGTVVLARLVLVNE